MANKAKQSKVSQWQCRKYVPSSNNVLTESQLLGTIWQSQGRKHYSNILFHQFAQAVADNQKSRPSATTINNERET